MQQSIHVPAILLVDKDLLSWQHRRNTQLFLFFQLWLRENFEMKNHDSMFPGNPSLPVAFLIELPQQPKAQQHFIVVGN